MASGSTSTIAVAVLLLCYEEKEKYFSLKVDYFH